MVVICIFTSTVVKGILMNDCNNEIARVILEGLEGDPPRLGTPARW